MTARAVGRRAVDRPVATLLLTAGGVTLSAQVISLYLGWNVMPAKVLELVLLLGITTSLVARSGGRAAVRALYRGLRRWRVGLPTYLFVLAALPVLTFLVAAASGSLEEPKDGWGLVLPLYLLFLAFGAITANLWEETVWGGFVQVRLMSRHGLLAGSLLTAVPFFVIHLPLAFEVDGWPGTSWKDAFVTWSFLLISAPFFRYLVGIVLIDSGSLFAVGLLHASFNASGALPILSGGGWQYVPAMITLTVVAAGWRHRQGKSLVEGSVPTSFPEKVVVGMADPSLSDRPATVSMATGAGVRNT